MKIRDKEPTLEMQVGIGKEYFVRGGIEAKGYTLFKDLLGFLAEMKIDQLGKATTFRRGVKQVGGSVVDSLILDDRKYNDSKREEKLELYYSLNKDRKGQPIGLRFFTHSDPDVMLCVFNKLKNEFISSGLSELKYLSDGYEVKEW